MERSCTPPSYFFVKIRTPSFREVVIDTKKYLAEFFGITGTLKPLPDNQADPKENSTMSLVPENRYVDFWGNPFTLTEIRASSGNMKRDTQVKVEDNYLVWCLRDISQGESFVVFRDDGDQSSRQHLALPISKFNDFFKPM